MPLVFLVAAFHHLMRVLLEPAINLLSQFRYLWGNLVLFLVFYCKDKVCICHMLTLSYVHWLNINIGVGKLACTSMGGGRPLQLNPSQLKGLLYMYHFVCPLSHGSLNVSVNLCWDYTSIYLAFYLLCPAWDK